MNAITSNNMQVTTIPTVDVIFDDYLAGQLTEGTRRVYERDITQIFGGGVPTWAEIEAFTPEKLIAWRNAAWDMGKGLAATTINRKLTALKTFFDHLVARQFLSYNPANPKLVRRIKEKRVAGAKLGITSGEMDSLLAACHIGKNKRMNVRDYTIITLMYTCLLRRSEASAFYWRDLGRDGGRSILKLPLSKGGANDFVPLEPAMVAQLDRYYEEMGGAETWLAFYGKPIMDCPVFLSLDNNHRFEQLSDHSINTIVKRRAVLAGIQPISAHILRHTGITHLLAGGVSTVDVQSMARHTDPKQTMHYALLLRRLQNSPGNILAVKI